MSFRSLNDDAREYLLAILALRRDKRWRAGLLQGAVSFGVIRQVEYMRLAHQVERGTRKPRTTWEMR